MSKIIDLAAFQPEPIEFILPNGEKYIVPATISVSYMTKLTAIQEKVKNVKTPIEQLEILQEMAYMILSLDKSKDITLEKVKTDLDDIRLLSALTQAFHEHINETANSVIPTGEDSPNKNAPSDK